MCRYKKNFNIHFISLYISLFVHFRQHSPYDNKCISILHLYNKIVFFTYLPSLPLHLISKQFLQNKETLFCDYCQFSLHVVFHHSFIPLLVYFIDQHTLISYKCNFANKLVPFPSSISTSGATIPSALFKIYFKKKSHHK